MCSGLPPVSSQLRLVKLVHGVGSQAKRLIGKIAHVELFIPCTHMVHTFRCVLMKVLEMDLIEIFFITLVVCVECFFPPGNLQRFTAQKTVITTK